MTRRPAGDLALATAVAAAVSAAAWVGYGRHAGIVTFEILAPLGWLAVLVCDRLIAQRARLGGLRRQFAAIAVVIVAIMAIAPSCSSCSSPRCSSRAWTPSSPCSS